MSRASEISSAPFGVALIGFCPPALAQSGPDWTAAEQQFATVCATCHGTGARGAERGPSLVLSQTLRNRSETEIRDLIRNGTPGGMPPFALPENQLETLARWIHFLNAPAFDFPPAGDAAKGEQFFFGEGQCSSCHMVAGRGKVKGPDLSDVGRRLPLQDIELSLDKPGTRARLGSLLPLLCVVSTGPVEGGQRENAGWANAARIRTRPGDP